MSNAKKSATKMTCMTLSPRYLSEIDHDGFSLAADVVDSVQASLLVKAVEQCPASPHDRMPAIAYGRRDLLRVPEIARLASSEPIRALVNPVLGENAFCVRGIWFDKLPEANWNVAWHQDLTIAVRERIDVARFSAWSIKEGIFHVQPPVKLLQRMLAVRIISTTAAMEMDPCALWLARIIAADYRPMPSSSGRERTAR